MAESGLTFHAHAPPGEWLNDPNGLVHADGRWRLFAQHRADGPEFRATGWARLSSADLLRWSWDGPVLPPTADDWIYSGSVRPTSDGLEALLTLHDTAGAGERQARFASADAGATWRPLPLAMPPIASGPNARDPFVFERDGRRFALLALPCPWTGWEAAPPSRLAVLASDDGETWTEAGSIGPWSPPGVMWEVPSLLRLYGHDVLLISLVDRREGRAACSVQAWVGAFDGSSFTPDPRWPADGRPLDLGPDFYAAIPSCDDSGLVVAWLSSWKTARRFPWPGFAGGPISLPRRVSLLDDGYSFRLIHRPALNVVERFTRQVDGMPVVGCGMATIPGDYGFTLNVISSEARLTVLASDQDDDLHVWREGGDGLELRDTKRDALARCLERRLVLFLDGPIVELFLEPDGVAVSVALPSVGKPFTVQFCDDDLYDIDFTWFTVEAAE